MKILCCFLKHDYGDPKRGPSSEHQMFYTSLKGMGHQPKYFDFMTDLKQLGKRGMNAKLIHMVKNQKPHVLFAVLFQNQFQKNTLRYISEKTKTVTVNWFCDDSKRFDNFSKYWAPNFNWVVTTFAPAIKKYHQIGYNHAILSNWGFNHYRFVPAKKTNYLYDVSFIGQPNNDRLAYINFLKEKGIDVHCWGHNWPNGRASEKQMYQIFTQSKINLNFTTTSVKRSKQDEALIRMGMKKPLRQMKARLFEVTGAGGFLLTETVDRLDEYFDIGREIVTFSNKRNLLRQVKHYLASDRDRQQIASKGRKRTLKDHTYQQRLHNLFQKILP